MISFLNLSLLFWGAAFVAIPIVLHLIMRRKPRRFEFPALQFVQPRHQSSQRRLRLRHLLLLALRAGAIVVLAMALARPSVKFSGTWGSQEAPVAAAMVFDTSKRMEYQQENRTRLQVAQELGLWLLAQLPRESQIAVLDTRPGPGAFQVDRGAAKHRIERLTTLANSQSLTSTLEEAARLLSQSELARREIYVFTDMARAGWPDSLAARLRDRLAQMPDVGVYVIDVGAEEPTNAALGELKLSGQVLSNRSLLQVETEVSHTGAGGQRTVELHLLEPDPQQGDRTGLRPQKRDQRTFTLQPGQSRQIELSVGGLEVGTHQGYVAIVGQDGLACDDRRYFTVEVKRAWRILVAATQPAPRSAFFLTEALAPTHFRQRGQAQFDCRVVAFEELRKHPLEPYSAVCLVDPGPLEPRVWQKLANFVSDGRGLAVFLGRKAGAVESFNHPAAQELLPGKLLRQARRPDGGLHLAPRDFQHPILAALGDYADSIPWVSSPVYRYWQLDKLASGVHVVVPFNDGQPAILERPLGKGRVVTVTTPVSYDPTQEAWNRLLVGESWPFFILVNRMASYLVGGSDQQLNYFAGQTAVLQLDPEQQFRSYVLNALDAPDQPEVRLTPDLVQHVLTVTSTDTVGNFRVRAGGTSFGVDRGFSVNLTPEQTQLDRLSEDELAEVFGPMPYRVARNRSQIEGDRSMQRVGRELFPILALLLAAVLGAEHVVANRFYKD